MEQISNQSIYILSYNFYIYQKSFLSQKKDFSYLLKITQNNQKNIKIILI